MVTFVSQEEFHLVSALQYILSFALFPGSIYVNNALKSVSVR